MRLQRGAKEKGVTKTQRAKTWPCTWEGAHAWLQLAALHWNCEIGTRVVNDDGRLLRFTEHLAD